MQFSIGWLAQTCYALTAAATAAARDMRAQEQADCAAVPERASPSLIPKHVHTRRRPWGDFVPYIYAQTHTHAVNTYTHVSVVCTVGTSFRLLNAAAAGARENYSLVHFSSSSSLSCATSHASYGKSNISRDTDSGRYLNTFHTKLHITFFLRSPTVCARAGAHAK